MKCRECNAELPRSAHRCRHCGQPILHEKIWNNKRLRALFIGIIIVLIAVGAGFAVVASQDAAVNRSVKDAICNFQFDTAETRRHDVKLFPAGDNDLRTEIIRTGRLYQAGQYTQTLMYIDDLHENYADSELVFLPLSPAPWQYPNCDSRSLSTHWSTAACSMPWRPRACRRSTPRPPNDYSAQDYQTALAEYTVLAERNYSDSAKRLFSQTLTCAKACSSSRLHPI